MSNKLFYRLGLEDLVEDAPADEPESLEEMAGESSPESDMLAADQQGEEVESDADDAEAIQADTETMGEVAKGLEAALKSGRPTKDAIAFSNMAINAVNRKWFGEQTLTVSAESISSPEEAIVASMEGAMDKIKELGRALIEKLKKLWNTFSGWIKSVFDGSGKLVARGEALVKKVGEIKSAQYGTELKFEDHKDLKAIAVGGAITIDTVRKSSELLKKLSLSLGGLAKSALEMGNDAKTVIASADPDSGRINAIGEMANKTASAFSSLGEMKTAERGWATEGTTVQRLETELPGGMGLYVVTKVASKDSAKSSADMLRIVAKELNATKVQLKPFGEKEAAEPTGKIEKLNPSNLKTLATGWVDVAKSIGEYKKAYSQREALRGLTIKGLEDIAKEASADGDDDKAAVASARADFAKVFAAFWSYGITSDYTIVSYLTKTVKAYLAYGDLVLKNYGASVGKDDKSPTPPPVPEADTK